VTVPTDPPVIVVAHEATRTGSVRVLLDLLPGLRSLEAGPVAVRLLADGPLAAELRAHGRADPLHPHPRLVFANSALAAGALLDYPDDVPKVAYVHESRDALAVLEPAARAGLVDQAGLVLAVSERVRDDLVAFGVDPARVQLAPPTVSVGLPGPAEVEAARVELGAEPGDLLVVGCGEASWRKGADLFVDVIARLGPRPGIRAAWIGRRPRSFGRLLDGDARTLGLVERLRWVGEVADAAPHLAAADVLVMTSREDPQPLVPLEAAVVGTPSVAFELGGMGDLVAAGAAIGVPFPDTAAAARQVLQVLDAPETARSVLASARQLAARRAPERLVPEVAGMVRAHLGVPVSSSGSRDT
jgi:glycosyltransferase involved in cell wall biosynthesis